MWDRGETCVRDICAWNPYCCSCWKLTAECRAGTAEVAVAEPCWRCAESQLTRPGGVCKQPHLTSHPIGQLFRIYQSAVVIVEAGPGSKASGTPVLLGLQGSTAQGDRQCNSVRLGFPGWHARSVDDLAEHQRIAFANQWIDNDNLAIQMDARTLLHGTLPTVGAADGTLDICHHRHRGTQATATQRARN